MSAIGRNPLIELDKDGKEALAIRLRRTSRPVWSKTFDALVFFADKR
jgi:hypothetical protein